MTLTGVLTLHTNFLLGDHLGSTDAVTNVNALIVQKMSFEAWGRRREANWAAVADPALFDSSFTSRPALYRRHPGAILPPMLSSQT